MFLNGINYPNQIIEAIRNNKLVVFAGAGVSMGRPTNLPNFEDLAIKIAEGTEFERSNKNKESEPCEVFLGTMNANGIDVNEAAAQILSEACLEHNDEHEAIVNLFCDYDHIKIVTTNYDKMFEQVLEKKEHKIQVYDAPALPLGDDISGIVHIHGSIDNSKYMVVTDEDFGKAYLTEGYASRFLKQLFESYTVLFVGYSYNDTIVNYLTRAMSREQAQHRYILTYEKNAKWNNLSIEPILYRKGSFVKMTNSIKKLGDRARRSLMEWRGYLIEIADMPPSDQTYDSEVEYCLESTENTQILANCVNGAAWLNYLDGKGVFDNLYKMDASLSDKDRVWASWICNKIIGCYDEAFFKLLNKHGNKTSREFAESILFRIEENGFPTESLGKYVLICDRFLRDSYHIFRLVKKSYEGNQEALCNYLYKKMWDCETYTERGYLLGSEIGFKHTFLGDEYLVRRVWQTNIKTSDLSTAKDYLVFFREKIEEIHSLYVNLGIASKKSDPFHLSRLVLEEREGYHKEDMLYCMAEQMQQLSRFVSENDKAFLRKYISDGLESQSVLCINIFLKLLREADCITADEAFGLFVVNNLFLYKDCKEQAFLLIRKIWADLSSENKNTFIDLIESIETTEDNQEYEKYNWCVWIMSIDKTNTRINKIERDIKRRRGYVPREHPELDIYVESCSWKTNNKILSAEELYKLGCEKAVEKVINSTRDYYGENKWGQLDEFSRVITANESWGSRVATLLNNKPALDEEVWNHFFAATCSEKYSVEGIMDLIPQLIDGKGSGRYSKEISNLLWSYVQRDLYKQNYQKYESKTFECIKAIWRKREESIPKESLIILALNTTIGILLQTLIALISYNEDRIIKREYKMFMEKAFELKDLEHDIVLCVVIGHFNFFYFRDYNWIMKKSDAILRGKKQEYYASAWEGIVYFSRGLNRDIADSVSTIYLEAITHLNWLNDDVRKGLLELYTTLLIYIVPDPIAKYIPAFYKNASESDRVAFVNIIEQRLWNMKDEEQKQWWDSWLKRFFVNLITKNKPKTPIGKEISGLLNCLTKMKSIYSEAALIVCKANFPSDIDDVFLYSLKDGNYALEYPKETAKLLTTVLDSGKPYSHSSEFIKAIVGALRGLDKDEKHNLDEALLKQNIIR